MTLNSFSSGISFPEKVTFCENPLAFTWRRKVIKNTEVSFMRRLLFLTKHPQPFKGALQPIVRHSIVSQIMVQNEPALYNRTLWKFWRLPINRIPLKEKTGPAICLFHCKDPRK